VESPASDTNAVGQMTSYEGLAQPLPSVCSRAALGMYTGQYSSQVAHGGRLGSEILCGCYAQATVSFSGNTGCHCPR
jgi:hypothetical protein